MKTNLVLVIFLITVAACGYFGGKACQNRTGICEVVMAGGPR